MLSPRNSGFQGLPRSLRLAAAASVIILAAGLYLLGAQPLAVGLFPAPWDRLAHATTFAVVGSATGLASGTRGWRMVVCCVAGAVVVGAVDELHQTFLPGRSASWADFGADLAGGLSGAALLGMGYAAMQWRARRH